MTARATRTVGIIGGMGPEATCLLFQRIIRATPARRDQDHLHVIINCDPSVPDRTAALVAGGESPVASLVASAQLLERAGAHLLAMPCVTAHAFVEPVRRAVGVPLVSLVEETARAVNEQCGHARCVGLLATDGTVRSGVFGCLGERRRLIVPEAAQQAEVMAAIYGPRGVKTVGPNAEASRRMAAVAADLVRRGAEAIVAGCTEVPLALAAGDVAMPLMDTLDVLARAVVREATGACGGRTL
ncbi:MAG TPA: amino acid racemase [Phycisphaerae bacterium]|nr:amino acid racemase [Phycisphaerae bacterium]